MPHQVTAPLKPCHTVSYFEGFVLLFKCDLTNRWPFYLQINGANCFIILDVMPQHVNSPSYPCHIMSEFVDPSSNVTQSLDDLFLCKMKDEILNDGS